MSFVATPFKNSSFAVAALFAAHLALASSAFAAPRAISTRLDPRAPQPTTAGVTPSSQITHAGQYLISAQPLKHSKLRSVATRPNKVLSAATETAPLMAQISTRSPLSSNPSLPILSVSAQRSTPAVVSAVPVRATIVSSPVATPTPLSSRAGSPALLATMEMPSVKSTDKKAEDDRILLAQLEADLSSTQTSLNSTSQKLSAGQRELMSFSNTLRSAIIEAGDEGAGLHPFVRVASRYAGTPYVWGGESRYGFDCSGFIIRVMRDLGYKALPHSAAEQFKYGQPIAQGLLKPGDIVFFANTYKPGISHVGIYIGKGRFIHAASTRQGTIISSLSASPYRQKYAGARRLLTIKKKA